VRGLIVAAGLLAVVAVVGELAAPGLVEAGVEETVRANTRDVAHVKAHTSGSPFLPGLLLRGHVEHLEITLREVGGAPLPIGTVALQVDGIHLDVGAMYRGEIEVDDVEQGTVMIELEEQELSALLGVPVDLDSDLVEHVSGAVQVAAAGAGERIPVPEELLPCAPDLDVDPPYVRLSCTFDGVPGVLKTALGG
jgi:hypothetical protein